MSKQGSQVRYKDIGGGMNILDADTQIEDKECIVASNFSFEGNKLVTLSGYKTYNVVGSGAGRIQGLKQYGDYMVALKGGNLYVSIGGTVYIKTVVGATSDYNISIGKYTNIIIVITDKLGVEAPRVYEFDEVAHTFTTISLVSFTGIPTVSAFYQSKLLFGGILAAPNVLYFSKTWQATTPTAIYDFGGYSAGSQQVGDGTAITGFVTGQNRFHIAKKNSIWEITGTYDSGADAVSKSFQFTCSQTTATGSLSQETIINVEQDVFYFDGNSVRRLSYEANTLALKDASISEKIMPLISSLPLDQNNATCGFTYPFFKLFLRNEFSTYPNLGLVYNVINKSWSIQTGVYVSHVTSGYNKRSVSYFGSAYDGTIYEDNTTYSFDGGTIQTNFLSKSYDCGDRIDYKRFKEVEIQGKIAPGLEVFFDMYVGGNLVDTRTIFYPESRTSTTGSATSGAALAGAQGRNSADLIDFVYRFELFDDGRTYQFGVRSNGKGKFELHSHHITFIYVKPFDIHY